MTKIQKTEMSSWREDRGTGRKKETDNRKTDRRRFLKADFFGKNDSEKENDRTDRDEENGGKAEKRSRNPGAGSEKGAGDPDHAGGFRSFILQQSGNLRSLRQTAS